MEGLLLVGDLQQRLRELGGTLVCVSHDAIFTPVIAELAGERFVGSRLDPLDAMTFALALRVLSANPAEGIRGPDRGTCESTAQRGRPRPRHHQGN